MAKLANFFYCLSVERNQISLDQSESIDAKGVFTVLTLDFIPGLFSFSIVFSILDINSTSDNQVKIVFKDTKGKELINSGNIMMPPASANADAGLPTQYIGYNLSMDFRNVVFESEGEYATEIHFNDTLIETKSLFVKGKRQNEH